LKIDNLLGRGLLGAAVLGLVVSSAFAGTSQDDVNYSKETTKRFETIEPGAQLRVVNHHGNVYARFGGYENRVELLATTQKLDQGLPPLELRTRETEGGLVVDVAPEGQESAEAGSVDRRDRVDLVVFVPRGAVLEVETREDLIEAKGLESDVSASSLKGDIRIRSIKGRVRAKTDRGTIEVTLETGATPEPQELTTVTGEIEVYLREDADMSVDLATSGEISTDFTLTIEHRRFEEPGKYGTAVVGDGGPQLTLRSKRGAIRLFRLQKDFAPDDERDPGRKS